MNENMNEKQLKAFWLGCFIIASIIVISWLLLFLRPSYGDGDKTLIVRFSNIEKVTPGTKVTYAGKPIGKVSEIRQVFNAREFPTNDNGFYFFELVLKIDSHIKIYDTDEIILTTTGLLGEKSIAVVPRSGKPANEIKNEDAILYAESGKAIQDQLEQFTKTADQLFKNLNTFLVKNQDQLQQTFVTLEKATDSLDQFLSNVKQDELTSRFADAASQLAVAMQASTVMINEINNEKLVAELSKTSKNLSKITLDIQNRQGTLGRMIQDEELYLQINSTFCQLRSLVEDIRNYGIFFHYNKKWQRRQRCLQSLNNCQ